MFYYLNGIVAETGANLAVIDCGGVGYGCATTNYTIAQLKKGERGKLYTYLHVREDIFELYGFATQNELNSFKMLLGVSGVGPKAAIAILSELTPDAFAVAVASGDSKAITAANGVGPKLAQRVIMELKDKIANVGFISEESSSVSNAVNTVNSMSNTSEAIAALTALGYSQTEASVAVSKLQPSLSVEELIKGALKNMTLRF